MTQTTQWLERITSDSHRTISERLNVSHTTISRAANSPNPQPHLVRDIARIYGADPLQALHDARFFTESELTQYRTVSPLERTSSKELLQELLRREHGVREKPSNDCVF